MVQGCEGVEEVTRQVNKGINKVNFPKKCKGPVEDTELLLLDTAKETDKQRSRLKIDVRICSIRKDKLLIHP